MAPPTEAPRSQLDPLAADSDTDEILRHLSNVPPPQPTQFHVNRGAIPTTNEAPANVMNPPWQDARRQQQPPQLVPQPPPSPPPRFMADPGNAMHVIATARAIAAITATRLLLLLVLIGAAALWTITVLDPMPWRIASASIFSAMVLWPLVVLVLRKG